MRNGEVVLLMLLIMRFPVLKRLMSVINIKFLWLILLYILNYSDMIYLQLSHKTKL